jgi:hypothetical protein
MELYTLPKAQYRAEYVVEHAGNTLKFITFWNKLLYFR